MPSITHYYGNDFEVGQDATITAATQLPDVPAKRVHLTATGGAITIGTDGTVTAGSGFLLPANVSIDLFVGNLNRIWVISASGGVSWLVQR